MSEVHVMDHPLIQHKISYIRREDVGTKEFREVISEIASLMCYEATRDLKLQDVKIKIVDKGALDCTIRARVEAAVYRSNGQMEQLPWGGVIR